MAQAQDKFVLYSANICPFAQRAWLALLYKGVDFEILTCDLNDKQEFFTKAYAKALGHDPSSNGKVPILDHNGKFLTESLAIVRYLDLLFPDTKPLFPKKPIDRVAVELITEFAGGVVGGFYGVLSEKDDQKRQEKKKQLKGNCEISKEGPFYLGDQISFFEIATFPFVDRFIVNEFLFEKGQGMTLEECFEGNDRLKHWYEALKKQPFVQAVHAKIVKDSGEKTVYDFFIKQYKEYAKKR
ncbi:hypothetical protein RFI_12109 [Reticulomyxa filosa]|uniref:GST N-terminal domain-containing protein n=1 Tax=Reticulomyxa filosa TaxID=46433 RepID=X6NI59_RETFI|nr:hypothetical protein RFI_12109 [Reticulomyxa filosa]|eukprot:ETO25037.1 hypothetical protein RFI_12109 [Reticulomyxa filosa]